MRPERLSRELRAGSGGHLDNRRAVAALSLFSIGCMGLISLYQIGAIKHLPDLPLPGFDADKVDGSADAYGRLQIGDAFLGIGSYAMTAALAAAGGKNRIETAACFHWPLRRKRLSTPSRRAGLRTGK